MLEESCPIILVAGFRAFESSEHLNVCHPSILGDIWEV